MIQSGGVLKKGLTTIWQGTPATWPDSLAPSLGSYGAIYRRQLWVAVLVNKIANATARLPLKVYERAADGRSDASDHPYARLLRTPNKQQDPFMFWLWTVSTLNIYGEAFWGKVRDGGGRPVELVPLHPSNIKSEAVNGRVRWSYEDGRTRIESIDRWDLVHFKFYNPDSLLRGLSPLEPLRSTLENEDGARRANSALWRNGGRPSVFLRTERTLTDGAAKRVAASWNELHAGVDNWAKAAVLEEGLTADTVALNAEELQYVDSRRLNREESCAIYDVPPPVVHILDRATFSNITEQMRSMYRDTMAPKLGLIESTLETDLRDGRFGRQVEPDFGDEVYSEFLLDQVLRGDFETRVDSYAKLHQIGWPTNDFRRMENQEPVLGGDVSYVNAALAPLAKVEDGMSVADLTQALQKIYLSVGTVISADEAREILNRAGASLGPTPELGPAPTPLDAEAVRSVMGRLSWQKTLDDIDPAALVAGLNGHTPRVLAELAVAKSEGLSVPEFRERLKALGG